MERQLSPLDILKRERKLRGWSQEYIAKKLECDPKTVSRWERGENAPGPYYIQKLIDLFGKNAEDLGLLPNEEKPATIRPQVISSQQEWEEAPQVINFYGRERELVELKHWILVDRCRLILILGLGGIGK